MSFANYKIGELWRSFTPRRKQIANNLTSDLISLVVYNPTHFSDFIPTNKFEKWVTLEVADFDNVQTKLNFFYQADFMLFLTIKG